MTESITISRLFDAITGNAEDFHRDANRKIFVQKYSALLGQLKKLDSKVEQMHLFSSNESLDDISTENLKFLSIHYHMARFIQQFGGFGNDGTPDKKARLASLLEVNNLFMSYLHRTQDYNIIDKKQSDLLDSLKDSYHPELSEIEVKDPVMRRQSKIENYKKEKAFREALEVLQDRETLENMDDEVVRKILVDQLRYYALKSFQDLEDNLMEVELLKNMTKFEEEPTKTDEQDVRVKGKFDKGYTDKLESIERPVLSKDGRVLRPFTIVPSKNREETRREVQGTGQKLPTMTVEEFVDHELKNGGMVAPSNTNEHEDNADREDDYRYQDQETYRKREFDEFKDSHRKGSGNVKGNMG
ncbi:DEKNAAC101971 [Brettanomyces naardenensis]|uniref:DEKNAAC101971 n=1 Tax=Brettanomyces naardenensis TaxID=13370 RepID=A0A448YJ97_BRENA|nr:DEKNAAC101971 [Brettanomyces naardenensis]